MNMTCKSVLFKAILIDIMYSFRTSIKKLTMSNIDIKLGKIRFTPIESDGIKVVARIKNLVGGKITCLFDTNLIKFVKTHSTLSEPIETLALDFFDTFSSMSKNGLIRLSDNIETSDTWNDAVYYISFDIKIFYMGQVIPSKLIISIDEITAMYFKN